MRTLVRTLSSLAFGIASSALVGACLPTIDVSPPDGGYPQQSAYTYPGCSESGPDMCPNAGNFQCALFLITQKYNACHLDVDCVGVYTNDCLGYSDCHPVAVNRVLAGAFSEEVATEVLRYCGDGDGGAPCLMRGNCGLYWDGPLCRYGRCRYQLQGGDI